MPADSRQNERPFYVSYFLKRNRYAGACVNCGADVSEGDGFVQKNRDSGKYDTVCYECVGAHGRFIPDEINGKNLATGKPDLLGSCPKCGESVAVVKGKSGKWYICQTQPTRGEGDARRVVPWAPHTTEHCAEVQERSAVNRAAMEREDEARRHAAQWEPRHYGVHRPEVDPALNARLERMPEPYTGKLARRLGHELGNPYLERDLGFADAGDAQALFHEFREALHNGYTPFACGCGGEAHYNPHWSGYVCQSCGFRWRSNGQPMDDLDTPTDEWGKPIDWEQVAQTQEKYGTGGGA